MTLDEYIRENFPMTDKDIRYRMDVNLQREIRGKIDNPMPPIGDFRGSRRWHEKESEITMLLESVSTRAYKTVINWISDGMPKFQTPVMRDLGDSREKRYEIENETFENEFSPKDWQYFIPYGMRQHWKGMTMIEKFSAFEVGNRAADAFPR